MTRSNAIQRAKKVLSLAEDRSFPEETKHAEERLREMISTYDLMPHEIGVESDHRLFASYQEAYGLVIPEHCDTDVPRRHRGKDAWVCPICSGDMFSSGAFGIQCNACNFYYSFDPALEEAYEVQCGKNPTEMTV